MPVHPLYVSAGVLFILHQLLQKVWLISIPLADHYLDPLLCMPLLLGIWQWEKKLLFQHRVSAAEVWMLTALLSLVFEIVFPALSPKFTSDWRDILLYFAGTTLFLFVQTGYLNSVK
jgi:hypothetical protein